MLFWKKRKSTTQEINTSNHKPLEVNTSNLKELLLYIKREIGIDLLTKTTVIETKLMLFCERKKIGSFSQLLEKLKTDKELRQKLINLVTVNETYYYREEAQLHLAVDFALATPQAKILCAPCATGEEVYSLAMILQQRGASYSDFSILGIDINSEAILKAKDGLFSERSLHKLDSELRQKFFSSENGQFRAKKDSFSSINFKKVNIFEPEFLTIGTFDIIFSRNMLIYFDDEFRLETIRRFASLLKPDGRLFLGHADIIPENNYFEKRTNQRITYYIKKKQPF